MMESPELPKITLCMIVKNETAIIKECLESVYKYIDRYDITDTGSTDGTQDLIREFFEEKGIPGEVHQSDWKGFGDHNGKIGSRTESLRNCDGKAQYAWVIDADDYIHVGPGGFKWPEIMEADSYVLRIQRGEFSWWRNQVFKTGIDWRYVGVLHEYADCPKQDRQTIKVEGDYHVVARTEGQERNVGISPVEKYSKDAELLVEALKEEPGNHRYMFYLGQSYFDSQQWDKAFDAYTVRAAAGGWEEEAWYSAYRMAIIACIQQRPWPECSQLLLQAYNMRPHRAEPLWQLARIHRQERQEPRIGYLYAKTACEINFPEQDILFISNDVYDWQALDEFAACAFYAEDYVRGYNASIKLLQSTKTPEQEKKRIQENIGVYEQKLAQMQQQQQQMEQALNKQKEEEKQKLLQKRKSQANKKKKRDKSKR